MLYSLTAIVNRINELDSRILRTQMSLTQSELLDAAEKFETMFLSTLPVRPKPAQKKEAMIIALNNLEVAASTGTPELWTVLRYYYIVMQKLVQFERVLRLLRRQREDVVQAARFDFRANEGIEVKSMTVSKNGKKAQITFVQNKKSTTRHLQFRDGAWWGAVPSEAKRLGQFIRYDGIGR